MIISFSSTIFQNQDPDIQSTLAHILVALLTDNHFIENKSISRIFYNDKNKYIFNENNISKIYLSVHQRQNLKDYITNNRKSITQLHKNHLTHFTIGINLEAGEIHPNDAYKIITERSKIIVENGINDGKFIEGISQKYSGKKIRGSIYQLVDKAIKKGIIEADNAGGVGEIVKITQHWIDDHRYHKIYKYKLMAVFDSDKTHVNDFQTRYTKLIEFLKIRSISNPPTQTDKSYEESDLIVWHMLYKRKIENYIPLSILFDKFQSISPIQKTDLKNKTESELDFIQYDRDNIGQIKIKEEFPKIFIDNFSYRDLEERCEHHKVFLPEANELVSELEQILLKIAKII
ncbi:MAG: hypothetical protein ACFKPT_27445 [Gloeotrichia echinulata GP01]